MNKFISFTALFLSISVNTYAEISLSLVDNLNNLTVKIDADKNKIAVFENENSLWVISDNDDSILLNLPSDLRKKFNVEAGEALDVYGGSGARIQFKDTQNYEVSIIDELEAEKPLGVISLKEGIVISNNPKAKILKASSSALNKSFSVIPGSKNSGQKSKKNTDGYKIYDSKSGYIFSTENGRALKTLYKNQQHFLAENTDKLILLAKLIPERKNIFSTNREINKVPVKNIELVTMSSDKVKLEGKIDAYESLAAPQFAPIQNYIEAEPVKAIDTATVEEVVQISNTPFIKDENALDRALQKIESARQKINDINTPKSTALNDNLLNKSNNAITTRDDNNFDSFFGEEVEGFDFKEASIPTAIDSSTTVENDMDVFEIPDLDPTEPIFQVYGDGTEEAFQKYEHRILMAIANAPNQIRRQQYRLRLAKLYMSYKRSQEVLMVMENMPKIEDSKQLSDTSARILSGAANIVMNRPDEALFLLEKESDNFESDRKIWQAVAYEMKDDDEKALEQFPKYIEQADDYPNYLKKEIYVSYGRVLLRQEQLSELKKIMETLARKMQKLKLPPEAMILLARASIIERDDATAETLLAQVAASDNLEASFLAQYEFVSFLLRRGDLGNKQALEHLENLRYLWRGGMVEQEVLIKLGHMYIAKGDQRKGLERLKYHNIYFPTSKESSKITGVMTGAFTDLYLDESVTSELDPLTLLGLYYDFRELTPSGARGDQLIAQIGERLRRLGLFDHAIKILEHQLKFRVKDQNIKGVMGRNLATLYFLNHKFNDSLMALNRTEFSGYDDDLNLQRRYIEAENYMGLKKYDEALKILDDIDEEKSTKLMAKIGWIRSEYARVIENHQRIFDDKKNLPLQWTEDEKVDFVQLAVAYSNLGKLRDLENLKKRFKKQIMQDENITNIIDFLLKDQGSSMVDGTETKKELWARLTQSLSIFHEFADYYDDFVYNREADRRDKDVYNRRMRQMSAPARY